MSHENHDALLAAAEAALDATHARRAKLITMRSHVATEIANNELAMMQARRKLKATNKYVKDCAAWVRHAMKSNPHMDYDQVVADCPILPPE